MSKLVREVIKEFIRAKLFVKFKVNLIHSFTPLIYYLIKIHFIIIIIISYLVQHKFTVVITRLIKINLIKVIMEI